MPWLKVNGMVVHVDMTRGRRRPLVPCAFRAPGEAGHCGAVSGYLCDFPVNELNETCNMPLCGPHAYEVRRNRHYCPKHRKMAEVVGDRTPGRQRSLFENSYFPRGE